MKEFLDYFVLQENQKSFEINNFFASEIFDNLHAFVFIFDFEKKIPVWLNKYFETRMGYSKDDLKSISAESFIALIHPDCLNFFLHRISNYHSTDSTIKNTVYKLKTKDEQWIKMMVCTSIYKADQYGKIKYLIGFGAEIIGDELTKSLTDLGELELINKNLFLIGKLSTRELEIIVLIANCHTDKEIAEKLQISLNTAKTHRKNIINKLGLKNTASLVKFAIENKLL